MTTCGSGVQGDASSTMLRRCDYCTTPDGVRTDYGRRERVLQNAVRRLPLPTFESANCPIPQCCQSCLLASTAMSLPTPPTAPRGGQAHDEQQQKPKKRRCLRLYASDMSSPNLAQPWSRCVSKAQDWRQPNAPPSARNTTNTRAKLSQQQQTRAAGASSAQYGGTGGLS